MTVAASSARDVRRYGPTMYFPHWIGRGNEVGHLRGPGLYPDTMSLCGKKLFGADGALLGLWLPTKIALTFTRPCLRCLAALEKEGE